MIIEDGEITYNNIIKYGLIKYVGGFVSMICRDGCDYEVPFILCTYNFIAGIGRQPCTTCKPSSVAMVIVRMSFPKGQFLRSP